MKLHNFLFWTGLNSFAMEGYLDIGLAATLNIKTMQWLENNPDLIVTNCFAIACMVYLIGYPIWVFKFYSSRRHLWR